MSKTNLQLLKSLADEEQELYLNVCRARIRQLNEELDNEVEDNEDLQKFLKNKTKKTKESIKNTYFEWISRNDIYDATDCSAGAHNEHPSFASIKNEYEIPDVIWKSIKDIMNTDDTIAEKLKKIDALKPCNNNERTQKEVYRHILSMHLYKAHLFSDGQIKNYSEEDYKVKFWSFILEELFGSSSVTIKWWDTVPNSFRSLDTEPNLDLRVISSPSTARLDDFDKQCKVAKVHLDKLKLVLVAKHHLNYYHKKMKTDNILIPFMLITGFDCQLLGLRLIQPKLYCLDNIGTFSFPINKKHIKEGAIEDIVNILTFARVQAIELKNKINNLERTKHISKLAKDLRSTSGRDAWCTDVIWPSDQVIPGFAEEEKAEDNE